MGPNLVYYPWGDAHWRPYFTVGTGIASYYFQDELGQSVHESVLTLPVGAGVKYHADNWWAVRCCVMDNWSLGSQGLTSMHNISLTGGVEVHFGARRR